MLRKKTSSKLRPQNGRMPKQYKVSRSKKASRNSKKPATWRAMAVSSMAWLAAKYLTLILVLLSLWIALGAWFSVLSMRSLPINSIRISGANSVLQKDIGAVLKPFLGQDLNNLDLLALSRRISEIPEVLAAKARIDYPEGLRVIVVERKPVLKLQAANGESFLMDDAGVLLSKAQSDSLPEMLLPLEDAYAGLKIELEQLDEGLHLLENWPEPYLALRDNARIDIREPFQIVLDLEAIRQRVYLPRSSANEALGLYFEVSGQYPVESVSPQRVLVYDLRAWEARYGGRVYRSLQKP